MEMMEDRKLPVAHTMHYALYSSIWT